jgi:cold shock CspA family protein
MVLIKLL